MQRLGQHPEVSALAHYRRRVFARLRHYGHQCHTWNFGNFVSRMYFG